VSPTGLAVLGALVCVAVTVGGIALAQAAGHDEGSAWGRASRRRAPHRPGDRPTRTPSVDADPASVPAARPRLDR
jgi:hypothetical protein